VLPHPPAFSTLGTENPAINQMLHKILLPLLAIQSGVDPLSGRINHQQRHPINKKKTLSISTRIHGVLAIGK
jgi:hypothetical protein